MTQQRGFDFWNNWWGDYNSRPAFENKGKKRKSWRQRISYSYSGFLSQYHFDDSQDKEDIVRPNITLRGGSYFKSLEDEIYEAIAYQHKETINNTSYIESVIPKSMVRDIYKMFYNQKPKYVWDENKYWLLSLLKYCDNNLFRVFTVHRKNYTKVVVQEIVWQLFCLLTNDGRDTKSQDDDGKNPYLSALEQEGNSMPQDGNGDGESESENKDGDGENENKDGNDNGENENKDGDGDGENKDDGLRDTLPSVGMSEMPYNMRHAVEAIKQGLKDAAEKISNIQALTSSAGIDAFNGDIDLDKIQHIANRAKCGKLDFSWLGKLLTATSSGIKEGLKGKPRVVEESLLEADEVLEIPSMEEIIFPELLEDATVLTTKQSYVFDVYMDVSGSMNRSMKNATWQDRGESHEFTYSDFAKVLGLRLNAAKLLQDAYLFSKSIRKTKPNNLIAAEVGGGTDLEGVLGNIVITERMSLIITDAEDYIHTYTPLAFFFMVNPKGIDGIIHWLHNYQERPKVQETIKRYIRENRLCLFDGKRLYQAKEIKKELFK